MYENSQSTQITMLEDYEYVYYLCHKKWVSKTTQRLQLCRQWGGKIMMGIRRMGNVHHLACIVCGDKTDHWNKVPVCRDKGCRQKWYRIQGETEMVRKAILTDDLESIGHFKLSKIKEYGFTVIIVKELLCA